MDMSEEIFAISRAGHSPPEQVLTLSNPSVMILRDRYSWGYGDSIVAARWKRPGPLSHHTEQGFLNHMRLEHEQEIDLIDIYSIKLL